MSIAMLVPASRVAEGEWTLERGLQDVAERLGRPPTPEEAADFKKIVALDDKQRTEAAALQAELDAEGDHED